MRPQRAKKGLTAKRKAIEARIARFETTIRIAIEYLETGAHADWRGFGPLFTRKYKDGRPCHPHHDWVRNVFLPAFRRHLANAERALEGLAENP